MKLPSALAERGTAVLLKAATALANRERLVVAISICELLLLLLVSRILDGGGEKPSSMTNGRSSI